MFQLSTTYPLVCSRSALAIYIYLSSLVLQCSKRFDAENITQIDATLPQFEPAPQPLRHSFATCQCCAEVQQKKTWNTQEPTVVDEVRTGTYRQLFHPEQLISGKDDWGAGIFGSCIFKGFNWKGRRRQQFCPRASGLCMCACRFLNLIVSFRKNSWLKHEPHSAFRGACYIYSHSLFKSISWWCAFCCLGCSSTNQALHHWQGDCWLGAGSYS